MNGIANALGIGVVISFMTRGLGSLLRADGMLRQLQTRLGITKQSMMNMIPAGVVLVASIATLVVSFKTLKGALNMGMEFGELESQLVRVNAIYGESGSGFENYGADVLQLSREYGIAAIEVGEALEMIARSNVAAGQSTEVLNGALQIATIGNIDLAQAVDVMLSSLLATGRSVDQTQGTVNMLAKASHLGWIEMEDFAASLANAGMVAKNSDQPFEDLLAMIIMLQSAGISGSRSGSILRMTLQRLQAPSVKAQEVVGDLGVELYQTNGEMRLAIDILNDLQEAMTLKRETYIAETGADPAMELMGELLDLSEISQAEQIQWMDIFNRRSSQGVAVLTGMTRTVNGELMEGIELATYLKEEVASVEFGSYAEDVSQAILDSPTKVLERLATTWESIKLSIGASILKVLMPALEFTLKYLEKLASYLESNPQIAKGIGLAILVMSSGGIILGLMGVVLGLVMIFAQVIGASVAGAATVVIAMFGWVALIALAIALLAAIVYAVIKMWGPQIAWFFTTIANKIWELNKEAWLRVKGLITELGWVIRGAFENIWEWIKWLGTTIWNFIKFIGSTIKNFFIGVAEGAVSIWQNIVSAVTGFITNAVDNVKGAFVSMFNAIKMGINNVIEFFGGTGGLEMTAMPGTDQAAEDVAEFATGAYRVPETQTAVIHKDEVILQPGAEDYRSTNSGGGLSFGDININLTPTGNIAIDAEALFQQFMAKVEEETRRVKPAWA